MQAMQAIQAKMHGMMKAALRDEGRPRLVHRHHDFARAMGTDTPRGKMDETGSLAVAR